MASLLKDQISFTNANSIKKGHIVLIRGHVCKIVEINWSAPGKHGAAKLHFVGIDVFSKKKLEEINPSFALIQVPETLRTEVSVLLVQDDLVSVFLQDLSTTRLPLPQDEEIKEKILELWSKEIPMLVTIFSAMNQIEIVGVREDPSQA